jgi:hypothetical protein
MRALVVYESLFGNTKQVAEAIADGLRPTMEVELTHVADVWHADPAVDLLVVGGPTHAMSMTRPSTRAEAVKQGAPAGPDVGLREWLKTFRPGLSQPVLATFDTKLAKARRVPGSAAKAAARAGRRAGFALATRPQSFWVAGTPGPLAPGEVDRARAWGSSLARIAAERALPTR